MKYSKKRVYTTCAIILFIAAVFIFGSEKTKVVSYPNLEVAMESNEITPKNIFATVKLKNNWALLIDKNDSLGIYTFKKDKDGMFFENGHEYQGEIFKNPDNILSLDTFKKRTHAIRKKIYDNKKSVIYYYTINKKETNLKINNKKADKVIHYKKMV